MELWPETRMKWTYVTHRLDTSHAARVVPITADAGPGSVVLARVVSIGKHKDVEDSTGRRRMLFPGDYIVGALGHRYATDQYEGRGTATRTAGHLLGIGGVCGEVVSKNERMVDPTLIEWIGLVADESGRPLDLRQFALPRAHGFAPASARTILSVGASMNAGKTTTAAQMIRTLTGEDMRVAAAKITGTACRKDPGMMEDAGAVRVLDFTDCGHASTAHCSADDLIAIAMDLRAALLTERPDYLVYEIADGVFQRETRILLEDPGFHSTIDAVLFAGPDSLACESGVRLLRGYGYNVVATAGIVANSRLGMEETSFATGLPCLNGEMILNGRLRSALSVSWAA